MEDRMRQEGICMGRDRMFKLLREANLLVPKRKRHFFTTDSKHQFYKYANKAKDLQISRPEQLWVSDITYIKSREGNLYLSLVTDAWSRKIMGYHLTDHLKASGPIEALKMALSQRLYPKRKLMHHSDKGIQYCCDAYIQLLQQHNIEISMTSKYDPYENAIAERVNGTIKNEFELDKPLPDKQYAQREIARTIRIYNLLRPHLNCGMQAPEYSHRNINTGPKKLKTNPLWNQLFLNTFN